MQTLDLLSPGKSFNDISDKDKRDFYERCFEDRRYYIEKFLKIKTRDQRIIPLGLNEAQERFYGLVEAQERAGKPMRGVGLKPRRVGLSTGIQALMFQRAATHSNVHGLTVAHDLDSSQEMFEMDGLFFDELPYFLRPQKRYSNRKELVFENPDETARQKKPGLRSKLRTATASDEELGRSKEIHLLHCSEVAFWTNAASTMLSVCNSVADLQGTMIFKESTPNGIGNQFYKDYQAAKSADSDYFAYFMAWFEFHDYQRRLDMDQPEFADTITDEEHEIRKAYGLSFEQINWRRWCIRERCGRDPEKFAQEYPSNDVECFLLSGRRRFDQRILHKMLLAAVEPPARGFLKEEGSLVKFEESESGYVRMWKPPALAKRYCIGADVAEGLAHGDYSCAEVFDRDDFEQVAEWHGHIEPELFGEELAKLGKVYNDALIGVESNNHGYATNVALKNLGYQNLYWHRDDDKRGANKQSRLGWPTTSKTKPQMIDALAQGLADGAFIPSKETIGELMTYIIDDTGQTNAEEGCFDDRCMACAIASIIRRTAGLSRFFPSLNT